MMLAPSAPPAIHPAATSPGSLPPAIAVTASVSRVSKVLVVMADRTQCEVRATARVRQCIRRETVRADAGPARPRTSRRVTTPEDDSIGAEPQPLEKRGAG